MYLHGPIRQFLLIPLTKQNQFGKLQEDSAMKAAEKATWDLANKRIHNEIHMFIENVIFMVWLKEQENVNYS
jgi:hypothetical protein